MNIFYIADHGKMLTSEGVPFLHHLIKKGTISVIMMTALQGQLEIRWEGYLPYEIGE